MQFGKVDNIDSVNFILPKEHEFSKKTFKELSSTESPKFYIGCPVWAHKGFVGKLFPKGTQPKDFLKEYCKQYNSIEVNATLYGIPEEKTIESWKAAATPGFKFFPKFPQTVSHRKDFDRQDAEIDLFLSRVYQLDEYLGGCFIQFPPHFKTDKLKQLSNFFKKLPKDLTFSAELRHESWYENDSTKKEWFNLFKAHNITPIITDTSGRRDAIHQMIVNDKVFIRFTGNNLHPTDKPRIDDWIAMLLNWVNQGVQEVCFFVHQTEKPLCIETSNYLINQLNKKGGFDLYVPKNHQENNGELF